jgi:NAD(P)-dependent dehydrogenase (short-subunit alcohol dehydrogenase family)
MASTARVAIVTGGAYGIGRAIVREFASRGEVAVIADVHIERGRALETELRGEGASAFFVRTDVRDESAIRNMVQGAMDEWGRIDVLCNNAGVEQYLRPEEYSAQDWANLMDVNLRAAFLCSKYAYPHLRAGQGSIVNIASVQAVANEPNISIYAGTKAGLLGLTRGMALDWAPDGVRVNAISPGAIQTGMMEEFLAEQASPEETLASMRARIQLGRLGQPEDIAKVAWFLASPDAAYITGANIVVDGGVLTRLAL